MATLYIQKNTRPKSELLKMVNKNVESELTDALEDIVVQMCNNVDYTSDLHKIVCGITDFNDSKIVKKHYFYLIEAFQRMHGEDLREEALVFCNFLRLQLEHSNEYLRGRALSLLSNVSCIELIELLIKPICDNLYHSNPYVRINVFNTIGSICKNLKLDFSNLLVDSLQTETDPLALRQLINTILVFDVEAVIEYVNKTDLDLFTADVLGDILYKVANYEFSSRCLGHGSPLVQYKACINLLCIFLGSFLKGNKNYIDLQTTGQNLKQQKSEFELNSFNAHKNEQEIRNIVSLMIGIISREEFYYLREHSLNIFQLLYSRGSVNLEEYTADLIFIYKFHPKIAEKDFLFQSLNVLTIRKVFNVILNSFSQILSSNVALVDLLTKLLKTYNLGDESQIVSRIDFLLKIDNPELQYKLFQLLRQLKSPEIKKQILFNALKEVKFGKIYRTIIGQLGELISDNKLEDENMVNSFIAINVLLLTSDRFQPYCSNISFFAMVLANLLRGTQKESLISCAVAALMRFKTNKLDSNTNYVVNKCIRIIVSDESMCIEDKKDKNGNEAIKIIGEMRPINFGLTNTITDFTEIAVQNVTTYEVVRMSAYNDLISCEGNLEVVGNAINLNILCCNLSNCNLSLNFEFITSPNLENSNINKHYLEINTIKEINFKFVLSQIKSAYLIGRINFKLDEKEVSLNLEEISIDILKFLKAKKMDEQQFRFKWTQLIWENVYSNKIGNKLSENELFHHLKDKLSCSLVMKYEFEGFLIANLSCETILKSNVLINFCLRNDNGVFIKVRIRSCDEELVKSVSDAIRVLLINFKE